MHTAVAISARIRRPRSTMPFSIGFPDVVLPDAVALTQLQKCLPDELLTIVRPHVPHATMMLVHVSQESCEEAGCITLAK